MYKAIEIYNNIQLSIMVDGVLIHKRIMTGESKAAK